MPDSASQSFCPCTQIHRQRPRFTVLLRRHIDSRLCSALQDSLNVVSWKSTARPSCGASRSRWGRTPANTIGERIMASSAASSHLNALQSKHDGYEARLREEMARPAPDAATIQNIKKLKLRIKEELSRA
ncbi:MAG: DUF465 domain-containing protein [Pseudomonadota bacterium]